MRFPRIPTVLIVLVLVVASFAVSFLVGRRMLTMPKKDTSIMAELPPPVSVETYSPETPTPIPTKTPPPQTRTEKKWVGKGYTVQVGLFSKSRNAWNERARLRKMGYKAVVIKRGKYYRVQIGFYRGSAAAKSAAASIKKKGIEAISVRY